MSASIAGSVKATLNFSRIIDIRERDAMIHLTREVRDERNTSFLEVAVKFRFLECGFS